LPSCVDLFNLVVDLGRKVLPAPPGGGGGGAPPFPPGIGGGGAGTDPPFIGGGGGGGAAAIVAESELRDIGGGGGGGILTAAGGGGGGSEAEGGGTATFGCSIGGGGGGGGGAEGGNVWNFFGIIMNGAGGGGGGGGGGEETDIDACCRWEGVCVGLGEFGWNCLGDSGNSTSSITWSSLTIFWWWSSSFVSKSKTSSSDVSFTGLLSSTSISVIGSSSIFTICLGDILKDKRLTSTGFNFPTAWTLRDQRRGEAQELLGLSLDLEECFMNSGSTDLGVRGDEQLLSENEEVLVTNFPNELDFGLNSFFCSSSSMSNLSLANFIK